MNQKIVPALIAVAAALLIGLAAIIAVLLSAPDRRLARESRREAAADLVSSSGALEQAAAAVASPYSGGSLDNLVHFLSKDPGRRDFAGVRDRRRFEEYRQGNDIYIQAYLDGFGDGDFPEWAADFTGNARALFDRVRDDILILTGIPAGLTVFASPGGGPATPSAMDRVEEAIGIFAMHWIPPGEKLSGGRASRRALREYLLANRKFKRRMVALDQSWQQLIASLYNLTTNPRWQLAVGFDSALQADLDEVIILAVAADIFRRNRDLLSEVPDAGRALGEAESPGILRTPEFSYYKNIPEITGQTGDEVPTYFFAKVNLGYTFRDSWTQTWLNSRKEWLSDYFVSFFSRTVADDFSPINRGGEMRSEWMTARLKAEGIHPINSKIVLELPFGRRKVFGVRELALVRVNLLANP